PAALEKELAVAQKAKLAKGEFPQAYNQLTNEWVSKPAGTIDESHVAAGEKQSGDITPEKALQKAAAAKKKAENRTTAGADRGEAGGWYVGKPTAQLEAARKHEHQAQLELNALKEQQAKTNAVLERIPQALISGQVRVVPPPAPPAPNADGTMPAEAGSQ